MYIWNREEEAPNGSTAERHESIDRAFLLGFLNERDASALGPDDWSWNSGSEALAGLDTSAVSSEAAGHWSRFSSSDSSVRVFWSTGFETDAT